jgi:hypothetical protein
VVALAYTIAALAVLIALSARVGARFLACVIIALALTIRFDLFATGSLYSSTDLWTADAITASLVFLGMTVVLAHSRIPPANASSHPKIPPANASWERRLAAVGIAIAVPVGLVGAVQLAAPRTPRAAATPACAGASVAGGAFLATTPSTGINARSGPDTSYPQVQRFAANCTLAFEGYCIGEPTQDLVLKEFPDQRWLILHRPWQTWPWEDTPWGNPSYSFVAAGEVQSQSAESELGEAPNKACSHLGGWNPPAHVTLEPTLSHGVVDIRAFSKKAEIIGISIMSSKPLKDGSDPIFPLTSPTPTLTDETGSITATWNAQTVTGPAIDHGATLTLMASVCLGPAVADPGNYETRQFIWDGKVITPAPGRSVSIPNADVRRLQTSACRIAPDYKPKTRKSH